MQGEDDTREDARYGEAPRIFGITAAIALMALMFIMATGSL
jgi:hypothetical protein